MAIQINDLSFQYQEQTILQIPELTVPDGQFTLLFGPSGGGKSTLLKLIARLYPKYRGHLTGEITGNDRVAMMFQDPSLQFALDTPQHELEFTLENLQIDPTEITARIHQTLAFCQIEQFKDRQIMTLSGGEQQLVALAVAVAMDADIILLDEPFASLDHHHRSWILEKLMQLRQQGKTIIIADHDLNDYQEYQPQIIQVSNGQATYLADEQIQALLNVQTVTTPVDLPDADEPIIEFDDFTLQQGDQTLMEVPSLTVPANKITLVTGESGSGKTSLFKAITKRLPYQGTLKFNQTDVAKSKTQHLHQEIGVIFQHASDQFINITVQEELDLSRKHGHHPYFTEANLATTLNELGLDQLTDRVVYSLSGGQQKKLQVLVMLMMGQPVLMLDEPLTGLDRHSAQQIIDLISKCQATYPQTMLIISHQLALIDKLVDHHLHLANHRLTYQGVVAYES